MIMLADSASTAPEWGTVVTTFGSPAALVAAFVWILRMLRDFMNETRSANNTMVDKMVGHLENIGKATQSTAEGLNAAATTNLTVMHEGRELIRELTDLRRQYDGPRPSEPKPAGFDFKRSPG